jgi:hypothetical protein
MSPADLKMAVARLLAAEGLAPVIRALQQHCADVVTGDEAPREGEHAKAYELVDAHLTALLAVRNREPVRAQGVPLEDAPGAPPAPPAPAEATLTSVELHLNNDPSFTSGKWGSWVRSLGGTYTACRGGTHRRYVTLPATPEGLALCAELHKAFRCGMTTTWIGRHAGPPLPSWVEVQHVPQQEDDPVVYFLAEIARAKAEIAAAAKRAGRA